MVTAATANPMIAERDTPDECGQGYEPHRHPPREPAARSLPMEAVRDRRRDHERERGVECRGVLEWVDGRSRNARDTTALGDVDARHGETGDRQKKSMSVLLVTNCGDAERCQQCRRRSDPPHDPHQVVHRPDAVQR